jgi:hypothetical protein
VGHQTSGTQIARSLFAELRSDRTKQKANADALAF